MNSEEGMNISDSDIDKLIKEVDANHDDKIDYTEFLDMMNKGLKLDQ